MDERPEQIEQHIRHQRSELEDNFSELEEKVKGAFDWKTQFEERPGVMLGAAFVGGVLLAAILPSASRMSSHATSRYRSFKDAKDRSSAYGSEGALEAAPKRFAGPPSAVTKQALETWETLKNAAVSMGIAQLTGFVEEIVPGFSEHYKKAATGRPATFGSVPSSQETNWQKANGGTDYASHS
ncbi:MAG: hypothetical protein ABLQ96_03000 [Candidatus Acidiferrum sp.]